MKNNKNYSNFKWEVDVIYDALTYLSGICIKDFFLDPSSCVEVLRKGRKIFNDIFGDQLKAPSAGCPHLSYGHLCCLGANVLYPDNSDPSMRPFVSNLDEGIELLKRECDFSKNDLFKYYVNLQKQLVKEFPEELINFSGFGHQGPLTTAVLMRGQDFFFDLYDEPVKTKEFLNLITESIANFVYFIRKMNGKAQIDSKQGFLSDDFSSLVPPALWSQFVIPFWELYFKSTTTGERNLHVENLAQKHLKYLETCKINFYDPCISTLIKIEDIKNSIVIPFRWLLAEYNLAYMNTEDIEKWIIESVGSGANYIHTEVGQMICESGNTDKILSFIKISSKLKQLL